ncbi:TetR/AcrR family transcriptional regulator [Streptomyces cacaoi]|uniref:TetR/AcrR family transcriptional regulator n=1 Tax=Streptomyces cacaoi TaxID=1898 RepID=UPI001FD39191|nr:TetR-like C-terminal domain-containing protein [Streptomyces cacaoi]
MSTSDRRSYHHGDLRAALQQSALQLLDAEGVDALSLRAVARHAGVSPNAPYRHYRDKDALLAALAAHGFTELAARLTDAVAHPAAPGADGADRAELAETTAAMARATVHYALEHPGLFHLMFGHPCIGHPEVVSASDAAQSVVATHLAAFVPPEAGESLKIGVWALVHGLSVLLLGGRLGALTPDRTDSLIDAVVHTLLDTGAARSTPRTGR